MLSPLLLAGIGTIAFNSNMMDPIAYREVSRASTRDTESDTSFQKFLDKEHPFSNLLYEPQDLSPIISDFTANNSRNYQLRKEAGEQFADMAWHFWHDFNWKKRLSITTAYRSYHVQEYLLGSYCRGKTGQCAQAGASEHQAGLALDLGVNGGSLDVASINRLKENAHKRGFHNTYQKGIEIDGQISEPRHRRYLGEELANELYKKQLSLAERYYLENQN